jgi:hypothetical protein
VWANQGYLSRHTETCTDEIAPGDCHPLTIDRWKYEGGVLQNSAGLKGVYFENWVGSNLPGPLFVGQHDFPEAPSNGAAAAKAAARTSPSRPIVDIPATLFELGDISQLLKDTIGKGVYKAIASNNLRYHFGIAPLVGDLFKLTDFNEHVDRRVKVIKRLRDNPGGYRRTVELFKSIKSSTGEVARLNSTNEVVNVGIERSTHLRITGHCRWKPDMSNDIFKLETDEELRSVARRAVLGLASPLSVDMLASAWEAMPWSWLLDWCGSFGDYINAHRNIIPAKLKTCAVIRHQILNAYWNDYFAPASGTSCSRGSWEREVRTRISVAPALVAHFPFLSGKQMGILASLAIMRA